ncbi:MAG: hypothetical protein ACK5AO_02790, partial [bacterium]
MASIFQSAKKTLAVVAISIFFIWHDATAQPNSNCYGPYNPTPAPVWGITEKFQSNPVVWNGATPTAADLDGDGISELIVTATDKTGYYTYKGNGSNKTTATKNYVINTSTYKSVQPAIANIITATSTPEVVMINAAGFVYIFNNVGGTETNFLYKSTTASQYTNIGTPYIVDIDEDGTAEIVVGSDVFGIVNGALVKRVAGPALNYSDGNTAATSGSTLDVAVVNIIASNPGKELVYGSRVYSINLTAGTMSILKDMKTISGFTTIAAGDNGPTAVADMDLDGDLDVVYHGMSGLYVWDPNSMQVLFNKAPSFFYLGFRGLPMIANVYNEKVNNGKAKDLPEIVIVTSAGTTAGALTAYNLNFPNANLWFITTDDMSGATGLTAFDFDGNGIREIVYRDQSKLRIINGNLATPVDYASIACASATWGEYPIVGDFDNDNEADIAVTGDDKLRVFNRAPNTFAWKDGPNYWNQRNYRIVNIDPNLTVPATETNAASSASINNNVAQLQFTDAPAGSSVPYGFTAVADASITISSITGTCPELIIAATITNSGAAPLITGTPISIYNGNPTTTNAILVGSYVTTNSVAIGASLNVRIPATLTTNISTIYVVVNDNGTTIRPFNLSTAFPNSAISECDYTNNMASSAVVCLDSDGDGITNVDDIDDDNDGVLDVTEYEACKNPFNFSALGTTSQTIDLGGGLLVSQVSTVATISGSDSNGNLVLSSGATATLNFNTPVILKIRHANNAAVAFDALDRWNISSTGATFHLSDPTTELTVNSNVNGAINFNPIGGSNSDSEPWVITTSQISSLTLKLESSNPFSDLRIEVACGDIDSDNDGIPNRLDLDSDGDGCTDAIEAGSSTTATSNLVYPTGSDANANGLLNNYEGATAGTINYTSNYSPYALSDNLAYCVDTDGDGILNINDVDDDNDGTLDVVESPSCFFLKDDWNTKNKTLFTYNSSGLTTLAPNQSLPSLADGNGTVAAVQFTTATAQSQLNKELFKVTFANPVQLDAWYIKKTSATQIFAATAASLKVQGSTDNVAWTDLTAAIASPLDATNVTVNGAISLTNSNKFTITQNAAKYKYYRIYGVAAANILAGIASEFYFDMNASYDGSLFPLVTCTSDTDKDGIYNYLDADSDGDGCSDAIEAGATTNNAVNYAFPTTGVGTNGLADVLETVADNAIINYNSKYSNAISNNLAYCADTDNDGISNTDDIDDDNDGILDAVESPYCFYSSADWLQGNRSDILVTSQLPMTAGQNLPNRLVNGTNLATNYDVRFVATTTGAPKEIFKFEMPTPIALNKIYLGYTSSTTVFWTATNIQLRGSNDNTTWTNLSAALPYNTSASLGAVPGVAGTTFASEFTVTQNAGKYKYYALVWTGGGSITADGYVNEAYFQTAASYIQSSAPRAICNTGSDKDGKPTHVDLDSDGDGCNDLVEAGVSSDPSASVLTGTMGANGLDNSVETAPESNTYNGTYTYMNARDSQVNACVDFDGDGVTDMKDLDDDNDGILDVVECPAPGTTPMLPKFRIESGAEQGQTLTGFPDELYIDIFVIDNNFNLRVNNTYITSVKEINLSWMGGIAYTAGATWATLPGGGFLQGGSPWLYPSTATKPLARVVINKFGEVKLLGLNQSTNVYEEMILRSATFNIVPINLTGTNTFVLDQDNEYSPTYLEAEFNSFTAAGTCDTDGDGIPNGQDLDSDADGCFDAVEAKVLNTSTTGIVAGTYGTNGFADSQETTAGSGAYKAVYFYNYAIESGINYCLDFDNDGVYDYVDLDDD